MKHTAARQILAGVMIYFTVISQVFGQAALLPNAEQQYFDNSGNPLASGSVTYYVPGTTTKKTTWTNSGQTVNNTNPVPLDIGGKGIMYGQGSYRQIVKDVNNNVIWDQPTTAYGASQPSGATGTDTAPVGSILPYSGFVVPTNWQLAYGQTLSRTSFAPLMAAITISAPSISCISTSTTLTGFTDTSIIRIGAPIEATCLPTSTTVASITNATTIVVSQAAAATSTVTATIFPWGNGDQVSTFNVPDYRGRAPVGADCMGYVASGNACGGNLTATYYGSNPGAGGQIGGSQSKNISIANINPFTPTISAITPAGTITNGAISLTSSSVVTAGNGGQLAAGNGLQLTTGFAATQGTSTFTGTPVTPTAGSLGSGTALSVVNPDATINYIIKVAPNSTGAGGVVSFGGMFGDIVCDSTLTCAPIGSVNTVSCTPASTSQLGCVQPDGVSVKVVGGLLTAIAGVASSVGIGSTTITGGANSDILSVSGGALAQITPSGTGSVCMTVSCVMTTPNIGAATATSINTNFFTAGGYTLAGATGKTLTFNNTLTLAGIDSTTLTFQGTDTYVGRTTTDTLTNKTINGASNALTVRLGSDVTGNLPLNNLATGSLDQVIGYFGSTTGNAISVNNCSNALTYSTSTHTFGCNSTAGTGTVTIVSASYPLSTGGSSITSTGTVTSVGPTDSGRLTYSSTTALSFLPYNGDTIRIAGVVYQIPASTGIAGLGAPTSVFLNGTAAQTLAINTTYYIYAFNNSGTITADFSATGHVTSSTAGNIGTEIKSGDNTRTLIGMVRTGGTVVYASDLQTASWFNRRNKTASQAQTLAAAGNTTAISSVTWGDESVAAGIAGLMGGSSAAITTLQPRIDGSSNPTTACQGTTAASGQIPLGCPIEYSLSEGNHTYDGALSATGGTPNLAGTSYVRIRG